MRQACRAFHQESWKWGMELRLIYNTPHLCAYHKPEPEFLLTYVMVLCSVRGDCFFVHICQIVDHHCLRLFFFTMFVMYTELNNIIQGRTQNQLTSCPFPGSKIKVTCPSFKFLMEYQWCHNWLHLVFLWNMYHFIIHNTFV